MRHLNENNIRYIQHKHEPIFTVEQSKSSEIIKNIPGLRTKNLFLKDESNNYYLICLKGEKRLNIKKLERLLKVKHLKFANAEELKHNLNLTPGSVSIFGMIYSKNVKLIIDKEAYESSIISFHPNINDKTLELTHENLLKFISSINIKPLILEL